MHDFRAPTSASVPSTGKVNIHSSVLPHYYSGRYTCLSPVQLVDTEVGSQATCSAWWVHLSANMRARLAQSVERQALNLMVVGSSPTVGVILYSLNA